MDFMKKYDEWLNSPSVDEKDKEDLKKLVDNEKELEDCFYKDLTFGTGGIRGVRGLGIFKWLNTPNSGGIKTGINAICTGIKF